jgi:hypothetical protein
MRELETFGQHVEAFGHSLKHVGFKITILNYIRSWKHNENLPKRKHKDIDFEVLSVLGRDLQSAKVHVYYAQSGILNLENLRSITEVLVRFHGALIGIAKEVVGGVEELD